jgi:hypothetical protein
MIGTNSVMNHGYGSTSDIEVLDIDSLDEAAAGIAPLLVAAGAGFALGFTGTAALIAGWWAK